MREVAIVSPVRTAVGNFGGGLKDIPAAELGATVIKVESPGGDDTRQWNPPHRDGVGVLGRERFHLGEHAQRVKFLDAPAMRRQVFLRMRELFERLAAEGAAAGSDQSSVRRLLRDDRVVVLGVRDQR